jgi:TonB family protein
MKPKFPILLLLLVVFPDLATSQVNIIGDSLIVNEVGMYLLKKHPFEDNKIICKFYDTNNKLKSHSELLTQNNELYSYDFVKLLNEKKLVNDGNYFEFFETGDTSLIARYDHGYKIDKEFRLFENGIIEELWEYISPVKANFTGYYPDGTRLIEFTKVNNKIEGIETHYFETGKVKLKIAHKSMGSGFKLTEYCNTGEIVKEEEWHTDAIIPSPCNLTGINPGLYLVTPLRFPGDLNEELNKLYKNETVNSYLKNNDLQFSFYVQKDGSLENLILENSPDIVNFIIKQWFRDLPKWKPEVFANVQVKCKVSFNLTKINGPFVLERMEYTSQLNNHAYNPAYIVKPCIYIAVEEMPVFQGGDAKLARYLSNHLTYPPSAAKENKQGVVYVQFIITKEGKVEGAKILRGIDPALDAEAVRVISSMPPWVPGKQGGRALPVQMTLPINFKLEK